MNEGSFIWKTEKFEGPLSLLLTLIEKRKLHISEVSLASIADEYIEFIKSTEFQDKDLTEFLGILSTLLLIKARSLFPGITLTESEEEDIEELEGHLRRYDILLKGARLIKASHLKKSFMDIKAIPQPKESKEFFRDLGIERILEAAQAIIIRIPRLASNYRNITIEKTVRLETVISEIMNRLSTSFTTTFSNLSKDAHSKIDIVMHFLAVLELLKAGILTARQDGDVGDIILERRSIELPRYGA